MSTKGTPKTKASAEKAAAGAPVVEKAKAGNPNSINSLSKLKNASDDVKRGDAFAVRPQDLIIDPDFNPRGAFAKDYWNRPDVKAHIRGLADSYKSGRFVPPITVIVRNADVIVRDGAHRQLALMLAISEGAPIQFTQVIEQKEDEIGQARLVLTANAGRPLSALEKAVQYGKFHAWGWTDAEIAKDIGMTSEHVRTTRQLLELPHEMKSLIAEDVIASTFAQKLYNEHGSRALEYINSAIAEKRQLKPSYDALEQSLLDLAHEHADNEEVVNAIKEVGEGLADLNGRSGDAAGDVGQASSGPENTSGEDPQVGGDAKALEDTQQAEPAKVKITGKDLKNIVPKAPKLSKATVEVMQRSFTSLAAGLAAAKVDGDGFLVKVSAHDFELLKELKERLAAETAPPQEPEVHPAQQDLLSANEEKKEAPLADE